VIFADTLQTMSQCNYFSLCNSPVSYPMHTMGSYPGSKVARMWSWLLSSIYSQG